MKRDVPAAKPGAAKDAAADQAQSKPMILKRLMVP
jgi:hypothetical protein